MQKRKGRARAGSGLRMRLQKRRVSLLRRQRLLGMMMDVQSCSRQ